MMLASLVFAVLGLWRLGVRAGTRNVLLLVTAFFVYFAYGPVLSLLLGQSVYVGTVLAHVEDACLAFDLALLSILIADAIVPQRLRFDDTKIRSGERIYVALPIVYTALAAYGLFIIGTRYGALSGHTKGLQIEAAGPFHYQYLLLEVYVVATFYLSRQTALQRQLWTLNVCVYIVYCLMTSERDFLFALAALVVHRDMLSNRRRSFRLSLVGVVAITGSAALFALRSVGEFSSSVVLQQGGSVLFVDTYIQRLVPSLLPYRWGETYVSALGRIVPVLGDTQEPLSQWFARTYAPTGTSAYGFSLTGEAYLNFGMLGIPVVFLVLTFAHRYLVNRADTGDWWPYASIYLTAAWMYAIRGDSVQLVGSIVYGSLFYAVLRATSWHKVNRPRSRIPDIGIRVSAGSGAGLDVVAQDQVAAGGQGVAD